MSKSSSRSAIIKEDSNTRQILRDVDPGYIYDDRKYGDFSQDIKPNVYVNSKWPEPKNETPPPGYYNTEQADKLLSTRSPEVVFHKSVMEPIDEAPISNKRKIGTPKISTSAKPKVPRAKIPKTPKVRSSIQRGGRNADN